MKRLAGLLVLMALSSPACARDSYSFSFGGHRIHIQASPHCRSLSCVSVSIPGVGHWHRRRDRDEDVASTNDLAPAPAPVQAQPAPAAAPPQAPPAAAPAPVAPPVTRAPAVTPVVQAPPAPAPVQTAPAPAPALAAAPPATPPASRPSVEVTNSTPPAVGFDTPRPPQGPAPAAGPQQAAKAQPSTTVDKPDTKPEGKPQEKPVVQTPPAASQPAPPIARVSQASEDDAADTPLGDWQTEGRNGLVRIEACGAALCGYALDPSTQEKRESILVNMKPKDDTRWAGNVYSRSSGNSYYGTMTLKEANTLRVEACALGRFFCSGNNWTRVDSTRPAKPDELATSRHEAPAQGS